MINVLPPPPLTVRRKNNINQDIEKKLEEFEEKFGVDYQMTKDGSKLVTNEMQA